MKSMFTKLTKMPENLHVDQVDRPKKYTTETFIEKSKELYGDDYFDHSQAVYVDMTTPLILICNGCKKVLKRAPTYHLKRKIHCQTCYTKKVSEEAQKSEWRVNARKALDIRKTNEEAFGCRMFADLMF